MLEHEIEKVKIKSKEWIDANVWDGEDRSGCEDDACIHTPDDLQGLIDSMLEGILEKIPQKCTYTKLK